MGWVLVCTTGIWLLTPAAQSRLNIKSSEYKMLSQVLQFPDTQVVESISGIRGRIERVRSPHLRFAPGLSLKYTDPLPAAEAVFVDRDQPLFLYEPNFSEGFDFARFTHSFLGYQIVGTPDRILLIMGTGGLAVACARAAGAQQIRIVQPDPNLAGMIRRHDARLEVVSETPRALLARTGEAFDLIHIENWGSSLPGADALNQDHVLTVDGLQECLRRLTPQGALVVSRKLLLPPSISLRLWATMREALVRFGQVEPERCMAMLRNWDTFTLVAMPRPLDDPQRVLEFARRLNFDIVYLSGAAESDANRFNVFDEPYHFREIRELEKAVRDGTAEGFLSEYLLDVKLRTDLQPFPGRFLKWDRIGDLYRSLGRRLQAIFLAGEVVVAVVFVQALVVAGVLLIVPAAAISKKSRMPPPSSIVFFSGGRGGFLVRRNAFHLCRNLFHRRPGDQSVCCAHDASGIIRRRRPFGPAPRAIMDKTGAACRRRRSGMRRRAALDFCRPPARVAGILAVCGACGQRDGPRICDGHALPDRHAFSAAPSGAPGLCMGCQRVRLDSGIDRRCSDRR